MGSERLKTLGPALILASVVGAGAAAVLLSDPDRPDAAGASGSPAAAPPSDRPSAAGSASPQPAPASAPGLAAARSSGADDLDPPPSAPAPPPSGPPTEPIERDPGASIRLRAIADRTLRGAPLALEVELVADASPPPEVTGAAFDVALAGGPWAQLPYPGPVRWGRARVALALPDAVLAGAAPAGVVRLVVRLRVRSAAGDATSEPLPVELFAPPGEEAAWEALRGLPVFGLRPGERAPDDLVPRLDAFLEEHPRSRYAPHVALERARIGLAAWSPEDPRHLAPSAVVERLGRVVDEHPHFSQGDRALFLLASALRTLGRPRQADAALERLLATYPLSDYAARARGKLGRPAGGEAR